MSTLIWCDGAIEELVRITEGFSGAEVVAACTKGALLAMEESDENEVVSLDHIVAAAKSFRPQITPEMIRYYRNIAAGFTI